MWLIGCPSIGASPSGDHITTCSSARTTVSVYLYHSGVRNIKLLKAKIIFFEQFFFILSSSRSLWVKWSFFSWDLNNKETRWVGRFDPLSAFIRCIFHSANRELMTPTFALCDCSLPRLLKIAILVDPKKRKPYYVTHCTPDPMWPFENSPLWLHKNKS